MKSSRREFILKSGAAAAALGLGMSYANSSTNKKIKKAKKYVDAQKKELNKLQKKLEGLVPHQTAAKKKTTKKKATKKKATKKKAAKKATKKKAKKYPKTAAAICGAIAWDILDKD